MHQLPWTACPPTPIAEAQAQEIALAQEGGLSTVDHPTTTWKYTPQDSPPLLHLFCSRP
jgi:hypothetical protein